MTRMMTITPPADNKITLQESFDTLETVARALCDGPTGALYRPKAPLEPLFATYFSLIDPDREKPFVSDIAEIVMEFAREKPVMVNKGQILWCTDTNGNIAPCDNVMDWMANSAAHVIKAQEKYPELKPPRPRKKKAHGLAPSAY